MPFAIFLIMLFTAGVAPLAAQEWQMHSDVRAAGFDTAPLDSVTVLLERSRSGAAMLVHRGHVVRAWGDVARPLPAHSVRKSLLSLLYGAAVARGTMDLDATLRELGVQDDPPLTEAEQGARVRDLISARSGISHGGAYADPGQMEQMPARGTHAPGASWYYSNWDFNTAEAVYERVTGEDLFEAYAVRLARPLGMEDFRASDGFEVLEPSVSRYPAHTLRISTRDLARVGVLMAAGGAWRGRQVVPAAWVAQSTSAVSDLGDGSGYGYMWWTYEAGALSAERYPHLSGLRIILARGTGGQALFVIPSLELVFVHRGDTDNGRDVSGGVIWQMLELVVGARSGEPTAAPQLVALAPTPLRSQVPAPSPQRFVTLAEPVMRGLTGDYAMQSGTARVFLHDGRLFMTVPGQGEAELFALSETEFTVRVLSGVRITFTRDATGAARSVELRIGDAVLTGTRR